MAEPGLLRILFYPQYQPYLWAEIVLEYFVEPQGLWESYCANHSICEFNDLINNGSAAMRYEVRLHNDGSATAKDIYVIVQTPDNIRVQAGTDWTQTANPQGQAALKANRSLHPGEVSVLFQSMFQQEYRLCPANSNTTSCHLVPHFDQVRLRLLFYAEGTQRQTAFVEFSPEDFDADHTSAVRRGTPLD